MTSQQVTIPKAYIINLSRATDRWKSITDQFTSQRITDYERIDAVLGSTLSDSEMSDATTFIGKTFSPLSVIGCGMSHIKAWEEIAASGKPGIVFEDDVVLNRDFKDSVETLTKYIPNDFDMVYLGCTGGCDYNGVEELSNIHTLIIGKLNGAVRKHTIINEKVFIPSMPLALHAYILSPTGASKLVNLIKGKLYTHIDAQILLSGSKSLNVYASRSRLAYQKVDINESSNTQTYPVLFNKVFSRYSDSYQIPMSYKMSCTLFRVGYFNVNLNFLLVLLLVIGLSFVFKSPGILIIILVFNLLEFLINTENYTDIAISALLAVYLHKKYLI